MSTLYETRRGSLSKQPSFTSVADSELGSPLADGFDKSTCTGTHKIHYRAAEMWDFTAGASSSSAAQPIDLTLVMPHYRARNQPVEHKMSVLLESVDAPIKAKICRQQHRSYFYLHVSAQSSDVVLYLPSDFKGQIHHRTKISFSAGFANRVMPHVSFNEMRRGDDLRSDLVVIDTQGSITLRMWDVDTGTVESKGKEVLKRVFGRSSAAEKKVHSSQGVNWDFLLDD